MDEFPTTWESVSIDDQLETLRLRVPGGWLVAVRDSTYETTQIVFVSNPTHEWTLTS